MVNSKNTTSQSDIQIVARKLVATASKVEQVMRPWREEAERRGQDEVRHAFLLAFEQMQRNYAAKMAQELERHQRPLLPSNQPPKGEFWPSLK